MSRFGKLIEQEKRALEVHLKGGFDEYAFCDLSTTEDDYNEYADDIRTKILALNIAEMLSKTPNGMLCCTGLEAYEDEEDESYPEYAMSAAFQAMATQLIKEAESKVG